MAAQATAEEKKTSASLAAWCAARIEARAARAALRAIEARVQVARAAVCAEREIELGADWRLEWTGSDGKKTAIRLDHAGNKECCPPIYMFSVHSINKGATIPWAPVAVPAAKTIESSENKLPLADPEESLPKSIELWFGKSCEAKYPTTPTWGYNGGGVRHDFDLRRVQFGPSYGSLELHVAPVQTSSLIGRVYVHTSHKQHKRCAALERKASTLDDESDPESEEDEESDMALE